MTTCGPIADTNGHTTGVRWQRCAGAVHDAARHKEGRMGEDAGHRDQLAKLLDRVWCSRDDRSRGVAAGFSNLLEGRSGEQRGTCVDEHEMPLKQVQSHWRHSSGRVSVHVNRRLCLALQERRKRMTMDDVGTLLLEPDPRGTVDRDLEKGS